MGNKNHCFIVMKVSDKSDLVAVRAIGPGWKSAFDFRA
jgi:hypothetical protein